MERPLISVIMPLYNSAHYMKESINSVLSQDYNNFELILVDDGSTDETEKIAKDYERIDNRVKLIIQENRGAGCARNTGIQFSKGEYICFVDSDDYLESNALQKLVEAIEPDYDLVQCRYVKRRKDESYYDGLWPESELKFSKLEAATDYLYNSKPIIRFSVWSKLYRKSAIENVFFPDIQLSEDVVFNAKALCHAQKIKYIPDELYCNISRDSSITHTILDKKRQESILTANELIYDVISKDNDLKILQKRVVWNRVVQYIFLSAQIFEGKQISWKNEIRNLRDECAKIHVEKENSFAKLWAVRLCYLVAPVLFSCAVSFLLKNRR